MASAIDADHDNARLSLTKLALAIPPTATTTADLPAPPNTTTTTTTTGVHADEPKAAVADSGMRPSHDHGHGHGHDHDHDHLHDHKVVDRDDASLHTPVDTVSSTASSCIITSPPYWLNPNLTEERDESPLPAYAHLRPPAGQPWRKEAAPALPAGAITLRDNDTPDDDRNSACWAKSVEISGHTLVSGGALPSSIGAFVVWNIRVETLNGSYLHIRKRYSEFDEFRGKLVATFPGFQGAMPKLPPKSLMYKLKPEFLEKRRAGLEYFLNCVLLNPEFSGSPVLKDFLFA